MYRYGYIEKSISLASVLKIIDIVSEDVWGKDLGEKCRVL